MSSALAPYDNNDNNRSNISNSNNNMESALTCSVCFSEYDPKYHQPVVLPACGHSFCRQCLKLLTKETSLACPACRHQHQDFQVDDLPINQALLSLSLTEGNNDNLTDHKAKDKNKCEKHEIRLSFWCTTCEEMACGECLYDTHQAPDHQCIRLHIHITQIKEKINLLSTESKTDAKQCWISSLNMVVSSLLKLEESSKFLQDTIKIEDINSSEDPHKILELFNTLTKQKSKLINLKDEIATSAEPESTSKHSLLTPLIVVSDDGKVGKVTSEEKGFHMYSLEVLNFDYNITMKVRNLFQCVPKDLPKVFLDISAGERSLGRVYITLWGHMQRARQFLYLCLGIKGSTYKGTRFDEVNDRGQPGEYIRGGDYTNSGGKGGAAILDNLEWSGEFSLPKTSGQVCGVGGEQNNTYGALFAVCLKDDPNDVFRCPFGEVTSGLDVFEVASRHDPFSLVYISNCGVVIPL